GITKGFGGQDLFQDLSWQSTGGQRVGLVGPNGAGKTTLCRILAGLEEPDAGRVSQARGATVGYLPQDVAGAAATSVLGEALSGFDEVWRLEREMEEVAAALAAAPTERLTEQYGELQHRFEALGGYRLETEARAILSGLGFAAADLARPLAEQARNQAKRVAEIERFIERFRYQATKARQVQSRIKMLERIDRVEVEAESRRIHFSFPEPPRTGRRVASLHGIHKAYGDLVVYAGVDLDIERGERIALVGVNGAGKSTMLRILAGVLPFDRGERTLGAHVVAHYYAQHQLDALDPSRSVLEELEVVAPDAARTRLRTILGSFLFSGDTVDKKIAVLSGGEKARLALAKVLTRPAALLCLDEPTN